jgi:putative transposase
MYLVGADYISARGAHIMRNNSIRLHGFDYSQNGAYFVTICTQNRKHLFGKIENGIMKPNDAGQMLKDCLKSINHHFPSVTIDVSIVMSDHLHKIIFIDHEGDQRANLSQIVQWFKINTTNAYIRQVHQGISPPFDKPLWQRGFWDRVIRNDDELQAIRNYIASNPERWMLKHKNTRNDF